MLAAAYGLVILTAKWWLESDSSLHASSLKQLPKVSLLCYNVDDGTYSKLIVIKIIDELLADGIDDALKTFLIAFGKLYTWYNFTRTWFHPILRVERCSA